MYVWFGETLQVASLQCSGHFFVWIYVKGVNDLYSRCIKKLWEKGSVYWGLGENVGLFFMTLFVNSLVFIDM